MTTTPTAPRSSRANVESQDLADRICRARADNWRLRRRTPWDEATRQDMIRADIDAIFRVGIESWAKRTPLGLRGAALDNLDPETQCRDEILRFLDSDALTLFLAGPIGTGKSYAAWALAHEVYGRWVTVDAWSWPRLLLDMRPGADGAAFDRACGVEFLLLDDIGAAKCTDWATEQMYSIAEARNANGLRTVLTTNSSYDQLVGMWGEPAMDRWRDRSVTAVFKGESRRGPAW